VLFKPDRRSPVRADRSVSGQDGSESRQWVRDRGLIRLFTLCAGEIAMSHRLLLAFIHSYLDPSSGAALATRELLELLATRGWDCRALICGVLDYRAVVG
jgi:hypothetical protein